MEAENPEATKDIVPIVSVTAVKDVALEGTDNKNIDPLETIEV